MTRRRRKQSHTRPRRARPRRRGCAGTLIGVALAFLLLFLVLPLAAVFAEALRKGFDAYLAALAEPDAWSAIRLTLLTAAIAVPLNLVFGVAAAWCIAKFEFRGKAFLITLIDLPFSVSPGDRRPDLRAGVRRAGLVRPLAGRRTTSRSSSPCRASCWPRSSSPSRSSRAS